MDEPSHGQWTVRLWHTRLLLVFGGPWLLTASTGTLFWLLTYSELLPGDSHWLKWMMKLHQMSLWPLLKQWYAPIVGVACCVQAALGAVLLWRRVMRHGSLSGGLLSGAGVRRWHVVVAAMASVPVGLQALSGALFRFNKSVLGDAASAEFWMSLHSGEWFGLAVWPAFVGLALLALLATGALISTWWPQLRARILAASKGGSAK